MKIALGGAIGNLNLGDTAILLANLDLLSTFLKRNDTVYIFTRECSFVGILCRQYKFKIVPIDLLRKYLYTVPCDIDNLQKAEDNLLAAQQNNDPYKEYICSSIHKIFKDIDVVHIIGGGFVNSLWLDCLFEIKMMVKLATLYKKRVIFTGQTFGPIYPEHKAIFKDMLSKANLIDMRDDNQLDFISECNSNCMVTQDDALFWHLDSTNIASKVRTYCEPSYINICIQKWQSLSEIQVKCFCQELAKYLNAFLQNHSDSTVNFLEFMIFDRDLDSAKSVIELMNPIYRNSCKLISIDKYSPETALRLIKNAMFNIGTRFHFAVFSLRAATPVYSIYIDDYYKAKIKGLHKLFQSSDFCSLDDFHANNLSEFEKSSQNNGFKNIIPTSQLFIRHRAKIRGISRVYARNTIQQKIYYGNMMRYLH